jgi:hypothetical protein
MIERHNKLRIKNESLRNELLIQISLSDQIDIFNIYIQIIEIKNKNKSCAHVQFLSIIDPKNDSNMTLGTKIMHFNNINFCIFIPIYY